MLDMLPPKAQPLSLTLGASGAYKRQAIAVVVADVQVHRARQRDGVAQVALEQGLVEDDDHRMGRSVPARPARPQVMGLTAAPALRSIACMVATPTRGGRATRVLVARPVGRAGAMLRRLRAAGVAASGLPTARIVRGAGPARGAARAGRGARRRRDRLHQSECGARRAARWRRACAPGPATAVLGDRPGHGARAGATRPGRRWRPPGATTARACSRIRPWPRARCAGATCCWWVRRAAAA